MNSILKKQSPHPIAKSINSVKCLVAAALSAGLLSTGVANASEDTTNDKAQSTTYHSATQYFQSEDIFNLEYVSEARVSPNGEQIVYVRRSNDIMTDSTRSNLWLASVDGKYHRPLLSSKKSYYSPRWSPDGSRLAYLSNEEGKPQLYIFTGQHHMVSRWQIHRIYHERRCQRKAVKR